VHLKLTHIFFLQIMSCAYTIQSKIRGYHVYGEHWITVLGEQLICEQEIGNMADRYAVAV